MKKIRQQWLKSHSEKIYEFRNLSEKSLIIKHTLTRFESFKQKCYNINPKREGYEVQINQNYSKC